MFLPDANVQSSNVTDGGDNQRRFLMAEKVRFLSDYRAMRMLRKPTGEQIMPNGTVAITTPEIVYEFENGALELRPGQDVLPDKWDEESGQFVEQDAIEWLRGTAEYGTKVHEVMPVAPDPAPLYVEIGRLEAAGDMAGLKELGDAEFASWNRDAVLETCAAAIDRVAEAQPVTK